MAYVHTNGVRLHVQRMPAGREDAPQVVLIHGLIDTMATYYFTLAGPLRALGFDVIAYDQRGHGRSDRPRHGYRVDDFTDDLAGLLRELGITRPVHLVGYSWGGTVAFRYAHRHPDAVASLVVIESEPPTTRWAGRTATDLDRFAERLAVPELVTQAEREGIFPSFDRRIAAFVGRLGATTLRDEVTDPAGLPTAYPNDWLRCPLLLVVGGRSSLHARLDTVLPLLPHCDLAVVDGQDHAVLAFAPQDVAGVVLPWLRDHAGTLVRS